MKFAKKDMNRVKRIIRAYTDKVVELMSWYCGFGLKLPLRIEENC
ncbi:MAG: hypothetical protein K0Q73_5769 [Paenibacillus sp.]|jgi:hypothetical protein|nr:hypothetical protein [Paenibacillus sp.]